VVPFLDILCNAQFLIVLCRLSWTHHLCQLVEISAIAFSTLVLKVSLHSHLRLIWNLTTRCLAVTGHGSVGECSRLSHLAADFWTHCSMVILTYLLICDWFLQLIQFLWFMCRWRYVHVFQRPSLKLNNRSFGVWFCCWVLSSVSKL